MRVQAASPALRGTDATLWRNPGTSQRRRTIRARLHDLVRGRPAQPQPGTVMIDDARFHARLAERKRHGADHRADGDDAADRAGAAVVMVSNTETKIAGNYRNSQEALYAADAAVERVVQDLLLIPRWNDILGRHGAVRLRRRRHDRVQEAARRRHDDAVLRHEYRDRAAPGRDRHARTCGAPTTRNGSCSPGGRSTTCCRTIRSTARCTSPSGSPTIPPKPTATRRPTRNGTLTLHAEAVGPAGTRKVIEVTVARTSEHGNRARPDRPARSGRAEPARAQGGGADARQGARRTCA